MRNKNDNLVNQCCTLLELSEFCNKYDLKLATIKDWRKNLPNYGKVMLEQIMENHKLKKELESKDKKLSILSNVLDEN